MGTLNNNTDCGCVEKDCRAGCGAVWGEWSDWGVCRAFDSSRCSGPGKRSKTRSCFNACDDISQTNLTQVEDCDVTEADFQKVFLNIWFMSDEQIEVRNF